MQLSPRGRAFLQGIELLRLTAYPDGDGFSIGYGHYGVPEGTTITRAQAEALFDDDVRTRYAPAVDRLVTPSTTQAEYDALLSLAYNIGTAGFAGSTAARLYAAGDKAGAADAFRMWNESQGAVDPVLVARRERERRLFLTGDYGDGSLPELGVPTASGAALGWAALTALGTYMLLSRTPVRRWLGAAT